MDGMVEKLPKEINEDLEMDSMLGKLEDSQVVSL